MMDDIEDDAVNLDAIAEQIQVFAMFLFALNGITEEESRKIRDLLYELLALEEEAPLPNKGN